MLNSDGSVVRLAVFVDDSGDSEMNGAPSNQLHQIGEYLMTIMVNDLRSGFVARGAYTHIQAEKMYRKRDYVPQKGRFLLVVALDDYVQRAEILEATASLYEGEKEQKVLEDSYRKSGRSWRHLVYELSRDIELKIINYISNGSPSSSLPGD
jgi:hypothetical protein